MKKIFSYGILSLVFLLIGTLTSCMSSDVIVTPDFPMPPTLPSLSDNYENHDENTSIENVNNKSIIERI